MPTDALLLVARRASGTAAVLETHADRLRRRDCADAVHTATYEQEPGRELRDTLADMTAETVFVVPVFATHCHDTIEAIPSALSHVPGTVQYGEPVGRSPAITDVLRDRATAHVDPGRDASVLLVAFGSSARPEPHETTQRHATRLAEGTAYGEVVTAYVLQNPAVECARYTVSNDRVVAVPLFVSACAETERAIPEALELDRGGIAYAEPLGTHPRVTDAIGAELAKQRVFADDAGADAVDRSPTATRPAIVTDGEGPPRE